MDVPLTFDINRLIKGGQYVTLKTFSVKDIALLD